MIRLLVTLVVFTHCVKATTKDERHKARPYPNAFKPKDDVTITSITCTPDAKHPAAHGELSAVITMKDPTEGKEIKHEIKEITSGYQFKIPTDVKLEMEWLFEQIQEVTIELKHKGTEFGILKTSLTHIVRESGKSKGTGLPVIDTKNHETTKAMCKFVTELDSDSKEPHLHKTSLMEWVGGYLNVFRAYLEVHHVGKDGKEELLYRSEYVKGDEQTGTWDWKAITIPNHFMTEGELLFELYDATELESTTYMGSTTFKANTQFQKSKINADDPEKSDLHKYEIGMADHDNKVDVKPHLLLLKISENAANTLLRQIRDGLELRVAIAIDVTGSNVGQKLHLLGTSPNQYQIVIKEAGDVCAQYDDDNVFPTMVFGKRPHNSAPFFIPQSDPKAKDGIHSVGGVLKEYKKTIEAMKYNDWSGPTNFAPVIEQIIPLAEKEKKDYHKKEVKGYYVLLIITDGGVSDYHNTVAKIVEASELPMSIIIAGVGMDLDEFKKMDALDSDEKLLYSENLKRSAKRDIVQFVPFYEYMEHVNKGDKKSPLKIIELSKPAMTQAILEELPGQIDSFNEILKQELGR